MELLLHYLPLIIIALIILICVIIYAIREPKKVKEWLVYACIQAEKTLGSGTGKLKLRTVYDMFINQFPSMSVLISFDTFSKWVDIALVEMREMIEQNEQIKEVIVSEKEN